MNGRRNTFAQLLYDERRRRHATQEAIVDELSEILPGGKTVRAYAGWERGEWLPRHTELPALATALRLELLTLEAAWESADRGRRKRAARRASSPVGGGT